MANNLPSTIPIVKDLLENNKTALAEALPKHISVQKLIRVCVTQMSKNPALQECTQVSLIGSLLSSCLYGLEPDGEEAALVPFWNGKKKCKEAQFIPMYKGLLKLARNSGDISLIYAEVVRVDDEFEMEKGMEPKLIHKPDLKGSGESEILGAYAVYKLKSGEADFVYMSYKEIWSHKPEKSTYGPWFDHTAEMFKKTALKRLLKIAPRSIDKEVAESSKEINLLEAMQTLPLMTPTQEAENSIEAPKQKQIELPKVDVQDLPFKDDGDEIPPPFKEA